MLCAKFVSVNQTTPHRQIHEIAAEAAAKGKPPAPKEIAKSSPSCSLFICASEQSACRYASGICGFKRATYSYRSAKQKVSHTLVWLQATCQVAEKSPKQREEEQLWFGILRNVSVIPTKACIFGTIFHSNVQTC